MVTINSYDAPVICNMSFFKSPKALWEEMTGKREAYKPEINPDHKYLYKALKDWFVEEYNLFPTSPSDKHHKDYGWMIATKGRLLLNDTRAGADVTDYSEPNAIYMPYIKTGTSGWGLAGSGAMPEDVRTQVAFEVACHDVERAYVAVFFKDVGFRCYIYERDRSLEAIIISLAKRFRDDAIHGYEPAFNEFELEEVKAASDKAAMPVSKVASGDVLSDAKALAEIERRILDLDGFRKTLVARLKEAMGDASLLVDKDNRVLASYKQQNKRRVFDAKAFKLERPDVYEQYRVTKEGNRPFKLEGLV